MNGRAQPRLCLVEDDPIMGESLMHRFALEGIACDWHREAGAALAAVESQGYALVLSDIRLPDMSGETLYQALLERCPAPPPILFITGYGTIDQAVRLLKLGARDYLTKPFDLDELLDRLRALAPSLFGGGAEVLAPVLGISPPMRRVQDLLARVAGHTVGVLITGESGVGKEYAARYLHDSADPEGRTPFEAVNCAALPEHLLEAELFGYERGAFTGAVRTHRGVFERADGGTLFLDEVGEMPPAMQAKLLRVIQERTVMRLGSERPIRVNVRLVCATNRDLRKLVEEGGFREDLFYRINVIHVPLPPLRERREDIAWFAHRFVEEYNQAHGVRHLLGPAGERFLQEQPWPGNVRELRHAIDRGCILGEGDLLGPLELGAAPWTAEGDGGGEAAGSAEDLRTYLEQCERRLIEETLESHEWRIADSAAALGISRKNLWEKMRKHDLQRDEE